MNGKDLFKRGFVNIVQAIMKRRRITSEFLEIDDQNPKAWNSLGIVFTS